MTNLRRLRGHPWLIWLEVILATVMLGVLAAPWQAVAPKVRLNRFVPYFLTVDQRGSLDMKGSVALTPHEVVIATLAKSQPTVHLLTSEAAFRVVFTASVLAKNGPDVYPLQIKVWNPRTEVAVEVWYGPDGWIMAGLRIGTEWISNTRLRRYVVGPSLTWRVDRSMRELVLEADGARSAARMRVDRQSFPMLFDQDTLSLTVSATSLLNGASKVSIRNPIFEIPEPTGYGARVRGPWFRIVTGIVTFLGVLVLVARTRGSGRWRMGRSDTLWAAALAIAALGIGWSLSSQPGHPVDAQNTLLWSRISAAYGPAAVGGYSLLATGGATTGGQPYLSATYPYPPLLSYLFWLVGSLAPPGREEQTLKAMVMVAVVAGGVTILLLLRWLGVEQSRAALAAGIYMLNPAVLFDTVVWGQTDAVVALFLLLAAAGIAGKSAPLLWTGLILGALAKQTGLAFAPIVFAIGAFRLGAQRLLRGLPVGIIIGFLALAPALVSGLHPAAVAYPTLSKSLAFVARDRIEPPNAIISQSSFTLWAAVAGLDGLRGWERFASPDVAPSRLGPSYFILSRGLFILFTSGLCLVLWQKRPLATGAALIALTAYGVGVAVLVTRVLPRYLYFGLTLSIAALPWLPRRWGWTLIVVLTTTMLTAMWGMLSAISLWYPNLLPTFDPAAGWLNEAALTVLSSDVGITVGGLLNVGVLAALVITLVKLRADPQGNQRP